MAGSDRDEKLAILNGIAGNYSATLAPETAKMWLFLLRDYSVRQTQAAALALIRRHGADVPFRSMPPFALLQAELDAQTGAVRGEENVKLQARAEWAALLERIERLGSWREADMNRTTAYCVRAFGGWEQVCRWKLDELNWRERDFLQLWEQSRGKEEFLALGCDGVAALDAPQGARAPGLEALRARKAVPEERVRRAALPGPGERRPAPAVPKPAFDPAALPPELRAAREALLAARAKRAV